MLAASVTSDFRIAINIAGIVVLDRVHASVCPPVCWVERDIRELALNGVQGIVDEALGLGTMGRRRKLAEPSHELVQADELGDQRLRHSINRIFYLRNQTWQ